MTEKNKRSLKQDLERGLKRIKLSSSLSGNPGPSTQSAQQANTPLMPGTDPQRMPEHSEPPHIPSVAPPPPPNVQPSDNARNPPLASILLVPPTIQQSAKSERWIELKTLASILGKGFNNFGPLKQAVEGIVAGIEAFETAAQNRTDYEMLRNNLNGLFHDLAEFFDASTPPIIAPTIINFAKGIERELDIVRRELSETRTGTHQTDVDRILKHYRRIQTLLQRVTSNVGFKTLRIADEQAMEARVKSLPHSPAAKYSSAESSDLRGQCTQDTRVDLLEDIYEWACNDRSQRIYWLNGMAGTGKTTIAYSFCERLEHSKKLAASFFCSRQLPSCRDVNRIVPTISYQLSRFSRPFRSAISRVLEQDPDIHNQPLLDQFKSLILEPFGQEKNTLPTDLIVVIDALDECENNNGVDRILSALLSCVWELPIKFFIASRPDAKILDRMRGLHGENVSTELRLHEIDRPTVRGDIETYLSTKLRPYTKLSAANLNTLVERSGVLFIYASTVVRYIGNDNFSRAEGRLKQLLSLSKGGSSNSEKDLNLLYQAVLDAAFNDSNLADQDRNEMKLVLDSVVCAQEPLSVDVMAALLGLDAEAVQAALRPLFSVLHVSDTAHAITTLHESFSDYLLDRARSGVFNCDANEHNAHLAKLCFDQIKIPNPPFNICNLESSYVLDKDVQDLPARIEKAISKQLLYACRYWVAHCLLVTAPQSLATRLQEFASERFLLWMEVMNLSGYLNEGVKALYSMRSWPMIVDCLDEGMRRLLRDTCEFATSFSSTPVMLSTPHLYVSTATFWPDQSPITKHYGQQQVRLIATQSTAMSARAAAPLARLHSEEYLASAAYSPDGACIVSGSVNGIIRIRDAHTGHPVGQPLEGHTGEVNSVTYSPDGTYVVSGSHDGTIRIWDAHTCQPAGQLLEGSVGIVTSVTYSPDGTYIASGSSDHTIRIWDAHTGQPLGRPLEGHSGCVNSVAYSPDGTYIVSGSDDNNIRIWNAHSDQPVGQPLEGHIDVVNSVAYSPDGAYIVSGSRDSTTRIWNAHTGQPVGQSLDGQFLEGDTDDVNSVAYSPDGAYIISGFGYGTIRIWDAHTGQLVGQPLKDDNVVISVAYSPDGAYIMSLCAYDHAIRIWDAHADQSVGRPSEGHTNYVMSVAYSPDGAYIVSGSWDYTIRIWDAHTGQPLGQPLEGHSGYINSVAYSPDGAYIVSGSCDNTIRIWDAHTSRPVGHPLEGHTGRINTVSYSPDGAYIVSGSWDGTVRIWDALTGLPVGQPLKVHTSSVNFVAYSPDDVYIASSASNSTIDTQDAYASQSAEQLSLEELRARSVDSVAYSPDCAYIVSGSGDCTVRVWDANSGQQVGQPLEGPSGYACSVAYSPDGAYIVSGSGENTIRIWDSRSGHLFGKPLEGHTSYIDSVAYSPDGAYIVSGSVDLTVRIWDAHTGQSVGQPLEGHTSTINSVAYSPDGAYVVSGSHDGTIRIWDAHTGQPARQPLKRQTDCVHSVTAYPLDAIYITSGSSDKIDTVWDTQSVISSDVLQGSRNAISQTARPLDVTPQVRPTKRRAPCNLGCQIDCPHMTWKLDKDGWIVFDGDKLIWVPPDLRVNLVRPENIALVSRSGFLQLDLDHNKLGKYWYKYFQPGRSTGL